MELNRAYVLFDRDGTVIEHVHHLVDVELVQFKRDLGTSLKLLQEAGFRFGIISNQSVIGHGLATHLEVEEINMRIVKYLHSIGIKIDFFYFCPHTPQDKCNCRKPEIGLGHRAVIEYGLSPADSFMVGDQESDMVFSKNLGCRSIQLAGNAEISQFADYYSDTLENAAKWILAQTVR